MATEQELERARAIAREVSRKALDDEAYDRELLNDPAGTLSAAGMPPFGVARFLLEEGLDEEEVRGYLSNFGITVRPTVFSAGQTRGAAGFSDTCCVCTGCCKSTQQQAGVNWRINPAAF